MNTRKLKTIAVSLLAGLTLAAGAHAQMGQMNMSGSCDMNGKSTPVQCGMMPTGSQMSMMGGKGMKMGKPMKMAGTMTMMGKKYHCTMTMTPQGK